MNFGHIELFVDKPIISRDFFINVLGFELVTDQNQNAIWVKLNEIELLLRKGKSYRTSTYQEANLGLVLYTDNLDSTKIKLQERGLKFDGIDVSEKCLTFQDPDGHWFQLVDPQNH